MLPIVPGSITFDSPVIGLIYSGSVLGDFLLFYSTPILGLPDIIYSDHGLDGPNGAGPDMLVLSDDRLTVSFDITLSTASDDVRFITAASAVPIPPSLILLSSGLLGVLGIAKRRKT